MNRLTWTLTTLLILGSQAWPQSPPPPPPVAAPPLPGPAADAPLVVDVVKSPTETPQMVESEPFDSCGCSSGCCNLAHPWRSRRTNDPNSCSTCDGYGVCGPAGRVWFDLDYLYWRINGDRLPPLVTTSPDGTPVAAAGVLPAATVLFGANNVYNNSYRSGVRANFGGWFNEAQTVGIQFGAFTIADSSINANFSSEGTPILARPFISVSANAAPTQASQLIAFPTVVSGNINITERNALNGFDFAFRGNGCCGENWRLDALIGYRYLRFSETLLIQEHLLAGPNSLPNTGIPPGTNVDSADRFDTSNRFQGAQVGFTGEARFWQRLVVTGTAKVSLGYVDQNVKLNGFTRFNPPDTENRVGGLLVLNSNIGSYRNNEASLVPEFSLALGYQATNHIRLKLGYDFMCLPNVQRPGRAIDLGIDRQRIPPPLAPTVDRPFFSYQPEALIVQGITAGLEIRY